MRSSASCLPRRCGMVTMSGSGIGDSRSDGLKCVDGQYGNRQPRLLFPERQRASRIESAVDRLLSQPGSCLARVLPGELFSGVRLMRLSALAAAALLLAVSQARAELLIYIDKGVQQMTVIKDGRAVFRWPVSTGIAQYDTPDGDFRPFRMEKDHFSKEWHNAPMPYSIFFTKQGHAIHGTNHTSIGRPASHGCVRLSVGHAEELWQLVTLEGMNKTKVVLTGEIPGSGAGARRRFPDEEVINGSGPAAT